MAVFVLIDSANMFNRSRFVTQGSIDIKVGMALQIMFGLVKKSWKDFNPDHAVFFFEGSSWRKKIYKPYKANRAAKKAAMTPKEREEDVLFWEVFTELQSFITEQTNCTVLQHNELEADDLIAGFINSHPNDTHIIISTDSDFHQLISPNVQQYNGIAETLVTHTGIFDKDGNRLVDKKTNLITAIPDPEWILFEKCIRGDTSDNVFSAYPGVRTKGTKNKVGLKDAYEDRHDKGWSWNNIMNSTWIDHNNEEHKVVDDYHRNKILIDLFAQPDDIKVKMYETILEQINSPKNITQVGIRFMKFCALYDLKMVAQNSHQYTTAFQARYPI